MTSLWLDRHPVVETDVPRGSRRFDEIVVGAGLTGLCAAVMLARRGRRVAVLEARRVGAVATGNTTAKLSVLQGSRLQQIKRRSYQKIVQAYVDANLAGQRWMLDFAHENGVAVQRRAAVSYASTREGVPTLEREYQVARSTGLPVRLSADAGLPFQTYAAVVLDGQAQFDPLDVLAALAAELRRLGGVIYEGVRVTGARATRPVLVQSTEGEFEGDHLVLATGIPVLDRGLYWAKLTAKRSYAMSFRVPGELPPDMYLSVDSPSRSIRTTPDADGELLLIGGNGHGVGRHPSPASLVDDLTEWTNRHWPGGERTHVWSAQDYESPHGVPFVGWLPRGRGRIYLATGFDKWGMTNAAQCALTLVGDLLGETPGWASVLHKRVTTPVALAVGIGMGAAVAKHYAVGYARALGRRLPEDPPAEGTGTMGREGVMPTGVSTVDGITCRVSGVCSHLHAIVSWNDQERTWDCPAHGSRFAADGSLLEGPAAKGLRLR
ncbi:FAD-dependent oxidoreductase [Okibacterium endophyticum]